MSPFTLFFIFFAYIQLISGQYIRNTFTSGLYNGYGKMGYGTTNRLTRYLPNVARGSYMPFGTKGVDYGSYGQTLAYSVGSNGVFVTSSSSIIPTGLSVFSDNLIIDGTLTVYGHLPVLATVALEGPKYSGGHGAVSYGCPANKLGTVKYFSGYYSGFTNLMRYNVAQNAYRY